MSDWIESEEFDGVCYSYRSWPIQDPEGVVARFNELKAYIRAQSSPSALRDAALEEACRLLERIHDLDVHGDVTERDWTEIRNFLLSRAKRFVALRQSAKEKL